MKRCKTFCCLGLTAVVWLVSSACGSSPSTSVRATTATAQLDFGIEMARRGLWSEALFRFEQAERLSPGSSKVLNNQAVAYEALGLFEKALERYQGAIQVDPGNKELRRNYSRFVEFYRAFRPESPAGEAAREPLDPEGSALEPEDAADDKPEDLTGAKPRPIPGSEAGHGSGT